MRAALGRWNEFSYTTTVSNCTILNEALQRYDYALLTRGTKPNVAAGLPVLSSVTVQISPDDSENLCQEYPKLSTDSSYEACKFTGTIFSNKLWRLRVQKVWKLF